MLLPSIFKNNFANDLFNDLFPSQFNSSLGSLQMNTDIKEYDNYYEMDLELPGFSKEDIMAELKNGYLTIKASHQTSNEEKDKDGKFIRRECYSGHFQRSFYIGEELREEQIDAKFENGILKMTIPKVEKREQLPEQKLITIR
jgi:HSP20 family molecular chaperone IbpA